LPGTLPNVFWLPPKSEMRFRAAALIFRVGRAGPFWAVTAFFAAAGSCAFAERRPPLPLAVRSAGGDEETFEERIVIVICTEYWDGGSALANASLTVANKHGYRAREVADDYDHMTPRNHMQNQQLAVECLTYKY
jgi:hypothetical protein